jgi:asparagine synthase (glutamine-hydrolysing)
VCGTAGFYGTFEKGLVAQIAGAIAHRSPDDVGEWYSPDGNVGLAHRGLGIVDLSPLGHQPITDASGTAVIVFNGEIYYFCELRAQLESERYSFRSHSDNEVPLVLIRARGEVMLSSLNGIFAFAIFDQADRTLFLACDAMGQAAVFQRESRRLCFRR